MAVTQQRLAEMSRSDTEPRDERADRLDACLAISALCMDLALAGQRQRDEAAAHERDGPPDSGTSASSGEQGT